MDTSQTIDHRTLTQLVASGVVRAVTVVGQAGGWVLAVKVGVAERLLAVKHSGQLRLFRRMDTVIAYLKSLGIGRFEVDANSYDEATAKAHHKRPDRAEAMKRMHEAAEYDAWFRAQVQEALDEADKPDAVFIPHEQVMAEWAEQRQALLRRAEQMEAQADGAHP